MRLLVLLLLLPVAACATDEDAAGTQNEGVVTPAEAPPSLAGEPDEIPADSAVAVPE